MVVPLAGYAPLEGRPLDMKTKTLRQPSECQLLHDSSFVLVVVGRDVLLGDVHLQQGLQADARVGQDEVHPRQRQGDVVERRRRDWRAFSSNGRVAVTR